MRVRWALEEVGQPYEVQLVSFEAMKQPAHRALHPFGQIPTYEDGALVLFESAAIVLHIAEHHDGLLPADAHACPRDRVDVHGTEHGRTADPRTSDAQVRGARQALVRRALAAGRGSHPRPPARTVRAPRRRRMARRRLQRGRSDDGARLMRLRASGLLDETPNLAAYVARSEARLAYRRAFDTQLALFKSQSPGG